MNYSYCIGNTNLIHIKISLLQVKLISYSVTVVSLEGLVNECVYVFSTIIHSSLSTLNSDDYHHKIYS